MTEENIKEALREVRLALLEADVNFKVVKDFIENVRSKAVGTEVIQSLSPGQQIIRIVHDELVAIMGGGSDNSLNLAAKPPVVLMMVGLQGAGKTTSCGKLGRHLKALKRTPLLVPADVYRPAAIEQRLKLRNPIYRETAAYGHMGRQPITVTKVFESPYNGRIETEVELFTWEKLDYVDQIKTAFGI